MASKFKIEKLPDMGEGNKPLIYLILFIIAVVIGFIIWKLFF